MCVTENLISCVHQYQLVITKVGVWSPVANADIFYAHYWSHVSLLQRCVFLKIWCNLSFTLLSIDWLSARLSGYCTYYRYMQIIDHLSAYCREVCVVKLDLMCPSTCYHGRRDFLWIIMICLCLPISYTCRCVCESFWFVYHLVIKQLGVIANITIQNILHKKCWWRLCLLQCGEAASLLSYCYASHLQWNVLINCLPIAERWLYFCFQKFDLMSPSSCYQARGWLLV